MSLFDAFKIYVCPECKHEFNPAGRNLFVKIKNLGSRYMKCPACGKRGWCKRKR